MWVVISHSVQLLREAAVFSVIAFYEPIDKIKPAFSVSHETGIGTVSYSPSKNRLDTIDLRVGQFVIVIKMAATVIYNRLEIRAVRFEEIAVCILDSDKAIFDKNASAARCVIQRLSL